MIFLWMAVLIGEHNDVWIVGREASKDCSQRQKMRLSATQKRFKKAIVSGRRRRFAV
jgi:hypothetical protein